MDIVLNVCEGIINFICQTFYLLSCAIQAKRNVIQAAWGQSREDSKCKAMWAPQQVQGQPRQFNDALS